MNDLPPYPTADELANATWHKASKSSTSNGCVEIAHVGDDWTAVRDSKNPGREPLLFTPHEWDCFLDGALKGEFNRTFN
jgi:hypothetical protein